MTAIKTAMIFSVSESGGCDRNSFFTVFLSLHEM